MTSCPIHGIAVCEGAPCVACESIRDGYPHGRGAPEAGKVVELMVAGPHWFVVCRTCDAVLALSNYAPTREDVRDHQVLHVCEKVEGEKRGAGDVAVLGPCKVKGLA